MAETLRDAAAAAVSEGGPFGSSVRSAATPEEASPGIDGPRDGLELLAEELSVAAIEAERDGFYRMARLLDDCRSDMAQRIVRGHLEERALVDRGRQSLELWHALREW